MLALQCENGRPMLPNLETSAYSQPFQPHYLLALRSSCLTKSIISQRASHVLGREWGARKDQHQRHTDLQSFAPIQPYADKHPLSDTRQ